MADDKPPPSSVEEAMERIMSMCGNKGYVFVWLFRETEQALRVLNQLPYVKYEPPYVTPRSGTDAFVVVMPGYQAPDSSVGATALVTGGFVTGQEAVTVMDVAKKAGSLDGSMVMPPKPVPLKQPDDVLEADLAFTMQGLIDAGKLLAGVKTQSDLEPAFRAAAERLSRLPTFEPLAAKLRTMADQARLYSDAEARTTALHIAKTLADALEPMSGSLQFLQEKRGKGATS